MANPNIVNASSIYGLTSYLVPSGTTATTWTALTPSTNALNRVNCIIATNVTATAATITVSVNSATSGGGTAYRLAYQITVPGNAALVIVDKGNPVYIGESQSVVVTSGTSSAVELVASYENIA